MQLSFGNYHGFGEQSALLEIDHCVESEIWRSDESDRT